MAAVGMLLAAGGSGAAEETVSFGRFRKVVVLRPPGAPREAVLLLSGEAGWGAGERQLAEPLVARGALVVGVDTPAYLRALGGKTCGYPAGDLESLSHFVQKKEALPDYLRPGVVGQGAGAALAYASLAQAPENTFTGAVGLGFSPELRMPGRLCAQGGLVRQRTADGRGERFSAPKALSAPWHLLVGERDTVFPAERARTFFQGVARVEVTGVPGVGRPLASPAAWRDALLPAEAALSVRAAPPPPVTREKSPEGVALVDVSDLPLVEVPASGKQGDTLAVFLSGDGGWAGIDQGVSAVLVAEGIPVVGWDSLRYFWKRRTPEETAKDLGRVMAHFLGAWKKQRVLLVGFSQGADVLPAVGARLAPEARRAVRALVLIAPGRLAELEVHVLGFVGGGGGDPILPEVKTLGGLPLVCVYGSEEADETLCTQLADVPGAHGVKLEGGHHLGGDYTAVGRALLEPLREPPPP